MGLSLGQIGPDSGVNVVVFLGAECPLSRLYATRLNEWQDKYPAAHILAIDANQHDTYAEVQAFTKEFDLHVPFVKDSGQAAELGATRNPEAFILAAGKVCYRGRIDDRYKPGRPHRAEPSRLDLEIALQEVLAGKPVSVPKTETVGCFIDLAEPAAAGAVAYPQVAAILHRRCASCHRPGEAAPFALLTYADAAGWAATIREVIEEGRMPPWSAEGGPFANDPSLTAGEKRLLLAWIEAGAPEGDPAAAPEPPTFKTGWQTDPDVILMMPGPFKIPAEGVIDYQEFVIDPGFRRDTYVQAVEIRPGNRAVVHHVNAFLRPKGAPDRSFYLSGLKDWYLGVYIPGNEPTTFGPGIGKLVPAGWTIVLQVHYVPVGKPQLDQTQIGLTTIPAEQVTHVAATRMLAVYDFRIAPNSLATLTQEERLEEDFMLAAVYPHMHLRGKSMRFDVEYPDGRLETVLDVKRYDFNWQHRYELAKPKRLPKGSVIRCTAVYDNTADNPFNPDPSAEVLDGEQTNDEMFRGAWDIYRPIATASYANVGVVAVLAIGVAVLIQSRRQTKHKHPPSAGGGRSHLQQPTRRFAKPR